MTIDGETDKEGYSQKIHAKAEENIEIIIFCKDCKKVKNRDVIYAKNGQIPIKHVKAKTTVKRDTNPVLIQIEIPKDMVLSADGLEMIKAKEGKRIKNGKHILYNDQAGNATIGYGLLVHKGEVGTDDESEKPYKNGINEDEAINSLKTKLAEFEGTVNESITVPIQQHEFDAFVLLTYNIGSDGFRGSSISSNFNEGKKAEAGAGFLNWNKIKVDGKLEESKGLINRRIEEK